jgi:hypothetical protein
MWTLARLAKGVFVLLIAGFVIYGAATQIERFRTPEEVMAGLRQSAGVSMALLPFMIVVMHFGSSSKAASALASVWLFFSAFILYRMTQVARVDYFLLATFLLSYGATLFVILSTVVYQRVAPILTRWRGKKWVKEIEYVYLLLGLIGLIGSLNRLDVVEGRGEGGERH